MLRLFLIGYFLVAPAMSEEFRAIPSGRTLAPTYLHDAPSPPRPIAQGNDGRTNPELPFCRIGTPNGISLESVVQQLVETTGRSDSQRQGLSLLSADALLAYVARITDARQRTEAVARIADHAFLFLDRIDNNDQGQLLAVLGEIAAILPIHDRNRLRIQERLQQTILAVNQPQFQNIRNAVQNRQFHPAAHVLQSALSGLVASLTGLPDSRQQQILRSLTENGIDQTLRSELSQYLTRRIYAQPQSGTVIREWNRGIDALEQLRSTQAPLEQAAIIANLVRANPRISENLRRTHHTLLPQLLQLQDRIRQDQQQSRLEFLRQAALITATATHIGFDVANLIDPSPICGAVSSGACLVSELLQTDSDRSNTRIALAATNLLPYLSRLGSFQRVASEISGRGRTARTLIQLSRGIDSIAHQLDRHKRTAQQVQIAIQALQGLPINTGRSSNLLNLTNNLLENAFNRHQFLSGGAFSRVENILSNAQTIFSTQTHETCGATAPIERFLDFVTQQASAMTNIRKQRPLQRLWNTLNSQPSPTTVRGQMPNPTPTPTNEGNPFETAAQRLFAIAEEPSPTR